MKYLVFSAFLHGMMLENCKDHRASVNAGSVVSAAWTQNKKADGTRQNPSLEPMWAVVQGGSWGVDFILPCTMETAVYTTKRFRVVLVTGFKPRAYLHQLLRIRALGQSQNLFIGHLSVSHVFSSFLDGGVSPPPREIKKCFSSWACEQRQQKHKASCAASSSSLSHQWVIAVWGVDWFCLGFGM